MGKDIGYNITTRNAFLTIQLIRQLGRLHVIPTINAALLGVLTGFVYV